MSNNIAVRNSLSEQALELIKSSIFSLNYPPGTRLIVDTLADSFDISRTPVREALKELVIQVLVEYDGIKYKVIDLDNRDIEDLYSIRISLESLAARGAAESITPEQLITIQQNSIKYLQTTDIQEIIDLDIEFHILIAKASHNNRLIRIISMLMDQSKLINRWLFNQNPDKELEKATINEHLLILEKIQNGDPESAAEEMTKHLESAKQRASE